jgi:hypothetical protein
MIDGVPRAQLEADSTSVAKLMQMIPVICRHDTPQRTR